MNDLGAILSRSRRALQLMVNEKGGIFNTEIHVKNFLRSMMAIQDIVSLGRVSGIGYHLSVVNQ